METNLTSIKRPLIQHGLPMTEIERKKNREPLVDRIKHYHKL